MIFSREDKSIHIFSNKSERQNSSPYFFYTNYFPFLLLTFASYFASYFVLNVFRHRFAVARSSKFTFADIKYFSLLVCLYNICYNLQKTALTSNIDKRIL